MMENEHPWKPPSQQRLPETPIASHQVPDVTLYSPARTQHTKSPPNILQRAITNDQILKNHQTLKYPMYKDDNYRKKPQTMQIKDDPITQNVYGNTKTIGPSVPDVSLFVTSRPASVETISKDCLPSEAHVLPPKPSVPDLTILDEELTLTVAKPYHTDQVFSDSYKKMLVNSHQNFLKKLRTDAEELQLDTVKKPGLFTKYQENPLKKYAPKPMVSSFPVTMKKDCNSSSILIDDMESTPLEKSDEMTFKRVAEMLNGLQQLVIPSTSPSKIEGKTPGDQKIQETKTLRRLASAFLTPQEFEHYEIDQELAKMEKHKTIAMI